MLGIRIVPATKPTTEYDAASFSTPIISTTPVVTPEPTIETISPEVETVFATTGAEDKPKKFKGPHAGLDEATFASLMDRVKEMTLDPNIMDPIRRHMMDFYDDLSKELRDRNSAETETKKD